MRTVLCVCVESNLNCVYRQYYTGSMGRSHVIMCVCCNRSRVTLHSEANQRVIKSAVVTRLLRSDGIMRR